MSQLRHEEGSGAGGTTKGLKGSKGEKIDEVLLKDSLLLESRLTLVLKTSI
jgi:hypothetical protein